MLNLIRPFLDRAIAYDWGREIAHRVTLRYWDWET
jgi:hypothetical protein